MLEKIRTFNKLVHLIEMSSENKLNISIDFENKYKPITSAKVDLWIEENDFGEPVTRIDSIKVPRSKRHKGEGRREVENIIKWSLEQGSKEIVIESERDAIPFWKKMG